MSVNGDYVRGVLTGREEESKRMIDKLIELGALRKSMLSAVIGQGHYVLYTEQGPLDVILEDLTESDKP